jgi:hypothetical protein
MKKRYRHDCDSCEYLGSISYPAPHYDTTRLGNELYHVMRNADLYFCAHADGGSVIARFSSKGSDYASSPYRLVETGITPDNRGKKGWSTSGPALATALLFAKVKGLIT